MSKAGQQNKKRSLSNLETEEIGFEIGKTLKPGQLVCLSGQLGAGKTTLIKGIGRGFAALSSDSVASPTFTYLHIYDCAPLIYHFDLYRIEEERQFYRRGFDEYLEEPGLMLIEWPEKVPSLLKRADMHIKITFVGAHERQIEIDRV